MEGAVMTGAILANTDIAPADLRGTSFANVTRGTSDLALEVQKILSEHSRWVDSNGATGSRAELRDEDLSRLDLSGIYLNGADLRGCNLTQSNISNGVFLLTDLSGANLVSNKSTREELTLPVPI